MAAKKKTKSKAKAAVRKNPGKALAGKMSKEELESLPSKFFGIAADRKYPMPNIPSAIDQKHKIERDFKKGKITKAQYTRACGRAAKIILGEIEEWPPMVTDYTGLRLNPAVSKPAKALIEAHSAGEKIRLEIEQIPVGQELEKKGFGVLQRKYDVSGGDFKLTHADFTFARALPEARIMKEKAARPMRRRKTDEGEMEMLGDVAAQSKAARQTTFSRKAGQEARVGYERQKKSAKHWLKTLDRALKEIAGQPYTAELDRTASKIRAEQSAWQSQIDQVESLRSERAEEDKSSSDLLMQSKQARVTFSQHSDKSTRSLDEQKKLAEKWRGKLRKAFDQLQQMPQSPEISTYRGLVRQELIEWRRLLSEMKIRKRTLVPEEEKAARALLKGVSTEDLVKEIDAFMRPLTERGGFQNLNMDQRLKRASGALDAIAALRRRDLDPKQRSMLADKEDEVMQVMQDIRGRAGTSLRSRLRKNPPEFLWKEFRAERTPDRRSYIDSKTGLDLSIFRVDESSYAIALSYQGENVQTYPLDVPKGELNWMFLESKGKNLASMYAPIYMANLEHPEAEFYVDLVQGDPDPKETKRVRRFVDRIGLGMTPEEERIYAQARKEQDDALYKAMKKSVLGVGRGIKKAGRKVTEPLRMTPEEERIYASAMRRQKDPLTESIQRIRARREGKGSKPASSGPSLQGIDFSEFDARTRQLRGGKKTMSERERTRLRRQAEAETLRDERELDRKIKRAIREKERQDRREEKLFTAELEKTHEDLVKGREVSSRDRKPKKKASKKTGRLRRLLKMNPSQAEHAKAGKDYLKKARQYWERYTKSMKYNDLMDSYKFLIMAHRELMYTEDESGLAEARQGMDAAREEILDRLKG